MRPTRRQKTGRIAAVTAGALALSIGATACGGDTTGPAGKELSGQSLTVAAVWTGVEAENFKKVLKAFTDETGADVKLVASGDNVSTFVGSKIEGKQAPEVVMVPQLGVVQQFAKKGWLVPLSEDVEMEATRNFANVWKDYGTVGDKFYGLYFKAANKSTVWYRPDAFDQAGVKPPKSYEDMLKAARTIGDSGTSPFAVAGEDGWTLTDWFENIYLSQAGPANYDKLADHTMPWTDETVVKALTTLGELFGDKDLLHKGSAGALRTDFPTSVEQVFGPEPKAAMVYEGDFVGGIAKDQFGRKLGEDAKFFPFPGVGGGDAPVVSGGDAAVVLKDGKNQKAAMRLMEFLAGPDAAEVWAGAGGFISPNKSLDLSAYGDDTTREIAKALVDAGDSVRFDMSDQAPAAFGGTKGAGQWKLLQDFLRDPSNPKATAAKLEAAAAKAFGNG
ncbi:carbohydrate ABC transporter substrate-binding protein [Streptomyces durbertensis]|uniref:Carbohydrate ABC transporter substrate-binding protein n=1 Tax=Streptomyces durbertensis TaxID=2448886 RepID=A0ABR6EMU5_9ACTN|nr:ABC transporter substrate-binding protein [Streptomyces durbertensis]MBB1246433.1 carbohydrate ABC transporter substrate-binding protein [Streptomyces durbertensis]